MPNSGSVKKFCERMHHYCSVASVGYDQLNRWDVRDGGETDCSALVITCLREAGFDVGAATYTGNMSTELTTRGWTRLPPDLSACRPGDILLNDSCHVAAVVSGEGWGATVAQASIDENGGIAGGAAGDQTGFETNERRVYDYPWDCILRWPHTDAAGAEREEQDMICIFQPNEESRLVYYDGHTCHSLGHPDEVEAIDMVYRQTHGGKSIPTFKLGTKKAPWAARFMEAVSHGA